MKDILEIIYNIVNNVKTSITIFISFIISCMIYSKIHGDFKFMLELDYMLNYFKDFPEKAFSGLLSFVIVISLISFFERYLSSIIFKIISKEYKSKFIEEVVNDVSNMTYFKKMNEEIPFYLYTKKVIYLTSPYLLLTTIAHLIGIIPNWFSILIIVIIFFVFNGVFVVQQSFKLSYIFKLFESKKEENESD